MTEKDARAIECREAISFAPWPKLLALREKLGRKAKEEKRFRFYSLYEHICRTDTLEAAWATVRRNNGAPGVDRVSIEQIAASPRKRSRIGGRAQKSLRERTYRAQPVRRVYILKPNGKLRPLGIPTIADRVVQAAVLLILEPIFEADFLDCSHGFRPDAGARGHPGVVHSLQEGYRAVYDADWQGLRHHPPRQAHRWIADAGGGRSQ